MFENNRLQGRIDGFEIFNFGIEHVMRVFRNGDTWDAHGALARLADVALIATGATGTSLAVSRAAPLSAFHIALVAFATAFALLWFPFVGVYESWRGRAKRHLATTVITAWFLALGSAVTLMFVLGLAQHVSTVWIVTWACIVGGTLVISRALVHSVLARLRSAGRDLRYVAIVGSGAHCEKILRSVETSPASGFRVVMKLDVHAKGNATQDGVVQYHDLAAFAADVREKNVQEVWLALSVAEERAALNVLDQFRNDLVNVRFMPDTRGHSVFEGDIVDLMGTPAISFMGSPLSSRALAQKAIFDRLFAAVVLILLGPLLATVALAVKVSSKGPALFTQQRKGANGKPFRIFKFRTMRLHAEDNGVVKQATRGDPRVTRVGAFLRRTSLDELPQFFNVLRGEMSVVGPRPHALQHDELYRGIVSNYIQRYRVKPGITGWAQVNGFRGETDRVEKMQRRVECDLYYLRNWSFGLDMRIVIATALKGLVHRNAF
jgi:Undecaprenyl-phosphate glucose phosphotransferase